MLCWFVTSIQLLHQCVSGIVHTARMPGVTPTLFINFHQPILLLFFSFSVSFHKQIIHQTVGKHVLFPDNNRIYGFWLSKQHIHLHLHELLTCWKSWTFSVCMSYNSLHYYGNIFFIFLLCWLLVTLFISFFPPCQFLPSSILIFCQLLLSVTCFLYFFLSILATFPN